MRYLFKAFFNDETIIHQTPDDVSSTNPSKSSYYDVAQRLEDVVYFGLYSPEHTYLVDLQDGHFEIDGVSFFVQDPSNQPPSSYIKDRRLIYYRTVTKHFVGNTEVGSDPIEFVIGWQATVDGKNYQSTISVI